MSEGIFISYRRTDQAAFTGRLYDRLEQAFPGRRLFMDVDSVPFGMDFITVLEQSVRDSDVMLVVIGADWFGANDSEGRPRIFQEGDFVHKEVALALEHHVRVIPVLVNDTAMVGEDQLPAPLKSLARRQAARIRNERFRNDCDSLIRAIKSALTEADERRVAEPEEKARQPPSKKHQVALWLGVGVTGAILLAGGGYYLVQESSRVSQQAAMDNTPQKTDPAPREPTEYMIFSNWTRALVRQRPDGPPQRTTFTVFENYVITSIATYHYLSKADKGQNILKRDDGTAVGRCDVATENNGWDWVCRQLHIEIPKGTYEIDVSDRASWSYDSESAEAGFGWVRGYLASAAPSSTPWAPGK